MATFFALFVLMCGAAFAVLTIALWRRREARLDRLTKKPVPAVATAPTNGSGPAAGGSRQRLRPRIVPREFTTESVTGLGQLASPCWSRRARHVGVVAAIRTMPNGRKFARLSLVNRDASKRLPLAELRRVN